jgi:multiple sugar transport system permease protein
MAELFAYPPRLVPLNPTLAAYRDVLFVSPLAHYLLNSVKLVCVTVVGALAIAVPSAYALSRLRFRRAALKPLVMLAMLAVQLISPLVTALPLYRWFSVIGLINSHIAVILVYVALSAPFATWMLTGFLDTVPVALDEAARIDGCSRLQSLHRVLLPVMLPGLASTAILLAISTWGQFIVPFVLLTRVDLYPVSVGILDYQSSSDSVSTHLLAAAAILSALPAMLTFLVLQRFIIGALTAGAVKG